MPGQAFQDCKIVNTPERLLSHLIPGNRSYLPLGQFISAPFHLERPCLIYGLIRFGLKSGQQLGNYLRPLGVGKIRRFLD